MRERSNKVSSLQALVGMFLALLLSACLCLAQGVSSSEAAEKVFDPVCGMKIDKETAVQAEYDGKTYCFCSEACFKKFESDPDNYACPCPPGGDDCPHCQGKSERCPCPVEKHKKGHEGHKHEHKH